MSNWKYICEVGDIPRQGARRVAREKGLEVAIFRNAADEIFALLDRCPHKGGPLSQAAAKDLIRAVANRPVSDAVVEDTARRIASLRATPEAKEGLAAFLDKRPAAWIAQG